MCSRGEASPSHAIAVVAAAGGYAAAPLLSPTRSIRGPDQHSSTPLALWPDSLPLSLVILIQCVREEKRRRRKDEFRISVFESGE